MIKRIFAFFGFIGVLFGAFGAHALKTMVTPNLLENWKTATLYLFIHTLAGLYAIHFASSLRSAYFFLSGIIVFSGSLYVFVLTQFSFAAMLTPIGGVLFLLGWLALILDITHEKKA